MNEKKLILNFGKQPVAKITDDQLNFLIHREFPNNIELIEKKLDKIKSDSKQGKNRISAAVLRIANKELEKIDFLIKKANEDFRDIVAEAEYPKSLSYGFGKRNENERKDDYLKDWEDYSDWKTKK